jgi:tetratricopeptide (TPR) repeat protein
LSDEHRDGYNVALLPASETINIFFSLAPSPKDRKLFEDLCKHLSSLKQQHLIEVWHESMISAGSNAKEIIRSYMRTADIIVLLMSADFFASEQCIEVEVRYALEQHATRDAQVIPVLLRPTIYEGFPFEEHKPLPLNGRAISAWKNRDMALTEVARGIHQVVKAIKDRLTSTYRPAKPPQFPLYMPPHKLNPFFTDRKEILSELEQYFTAKRSSSQTRVQVLAGMAGVGKTLLATEYAAHHQNEYHSVLWVNAASHDLLHANLLSLANQLGIPVTKDMDEQQHFAAIRRWLRDHDRWLLVLDDLDNFSLLDELILPQSDGHVLVITHSQATGSLTDAISVETLNDNEAALLLLRRAKRIPPQGAHDHATQDEYLAALAIAQEVEGYPLAIDQAGAYIEETQRTLGSYLALYQKYKAKFLEMRGRVVSDHPYPVTTTLLLTFEKIAQINPDALELLRFFAFLYPDALPDEMLLHGASALNNGSLRALVSDPFALDAAIATLSRFSLVHRLADTTTLKIQRIVQAVVIQQDVSKRLQRQLASQAVRLINAIFPEVRFTTWQECERYLPQAQHCSKLIRDFQLTLKEGCQLLERLGSYCSQRGCYTEANRYLTQALHLQEQQRRGDPLDTAQILNSLGLLYQRQARYQEAEALHQRALALRERLLGPEHPRTAESLHNLALLYGDQGEYRRAEQLYQRALSIEERTKGSDDPDVGRTLNNLALMYYHQEFYTQAQAAYQRALNIYERHLPANHPDIIYPLDGLGTLAEVEQNYQIAEQYYQRAYTICEQALGDQHPETAHCLNKLADVAEAQGNDQRAEILYQRALAIGEQALGPEHPDVALFLNNLGFLASKQKQYQRARQLYQRALDIYTQALGPTHTDTMSVLYNLEQLARKAGDGENMPSQDNQ